MCIDNTNNFRWVLVLWSIVGVRAGMGLIKLELSRKPKNLHVNYRNSGSYTFRDRSVHTDMASLTRLVILIKAMGSEILPPTCYILSDESSIPFYTTSIGYKELQTPDQY